MNDLGVVQCRNQSVVFENSPPDIVLQRIEQLLQEIRQNDVMMADRSRERKKRMSQLLQLNEILSDLPSLEQILESRSSISKGEDKPGDVKRFNEVIAAMKNRYWWSVIVDFHCCLQVGDLRSAYSVDELRSEEETLGERNSSCMINKVDNLWRLYANVSDNSVLGESHFDENLSEQNNILRHLAGQQLLVLGSTYGSHKVNKQHVQLTEITAAVILQAHTRRFLARKLCSGNKFEYGETINKLAEKAISNAPTSPGTEENMLSEHVKHEYTHHDCLPAVGVCSWIDDACNSSSHIDSEAFSNISRSDEVEQINVNGQSMRPITCTGRESDVDADELNFSDLCTTNVIEEESFSCCGQVNKIELLQRIILQDFKEGEFYPRLQVASCLVPAEKVRLFFVDLLQTLDRLPKNNHTSSCCGTDLLLSLLKYFVDKKQVNSLDQYSFQHIIIRLVFELDVDTNRYPDASNICTAFWNFLSMDGAKENDGDCIMVNLELYMKDIQDTSSSYSIEALYNGRKLDIIASRAEKTGLSILHDYAVEHMREERQNEASELLEDLKRYMCEVIPSTTIDELLFIDEVMEEVIILQGNSGQLHSSCVVGLLSNICFPQHQKLDHRDLQHKLSYFFKKNINDFRRIIYDFQEYDYDSHGFLDWRCFQNILYTRSSVYLCRFEVAQLAALLSRSQSEITSLQVNYKHLNRIANGEILSMPLLKFRMRKFLRSKRI